MQAGAMLLEGCKHAVRTAVLDRSGISGRRCEPPRSNTPNAPAAGTLACLAGLAG